MISEKTEQIASIRRRMALTLAGVALAALLCPVNIFSDNPRRPVKPVVDPSRQTTVAPDSIPIGKALPAGSEVEIEGISVAGDSLSLVPIEAIAVEPEAPQYTFNPDPNRAVWLSVLCPGLGQIYNRRYWKLPIVVGGFMGLGYATSWNNGMLRDYTRGYFDLMDNDPTTKSYMDFFPSTTREEDLNRTWLENVFKSRKDYYRRNRDLCIICMVGVYLLAIVDAYVDASMAHFDITPDLSMQVAPALIPDARNRLPGIGVQWALNF